MSEDRLEIWKPVVGYEGLYIVSNLGNVLRVPEKGRSSKNLCFGHADGYKRVQLSRDGKARSFSVHRLVLEAFAGPCPPGKEGSHLDGNRLNCNSNNLVWETKKENFARKESHGTLLFAENNPNAKLSNKDIIEIKNLRSKGWKLSAIANRYGVHFANISMICLDKSRKRG